MPAHGKLGGADPGYYLVTAYDKAAYRMGSAYGRNGNMFSPRLRYID